MHVCKYIYIYIYIYYVLLFGYVSCHVMLRHGMAWHGMVWYVCMICYAMLCYALLFYADVHANANEHPNTTCCKAM